MPESVSRLATDIGGDLLRGALLGTPLPLLDGRYRVDRILGRGATGVVVRARDERLARDVAIKVAPSSAASQRMLQEARALARMRRPAFVVQVWETASGRFSEASFVGLVNYIVMELVIGVTLRVWGAATQPGARDVLAVYAKVATGLANVHAAGLAHGDVKPDNIILDASGAPTLVDFGFAAPTQQARRGGQRGEVVGTPAYMAPEVLTGDVLPASDVYAFATSLSEALTGSLPVDGDLVDCSPRGPSGHLGEWLLPRPLREALTAALRPNPTQRPSIVELRAVVEDAANSTRSLRTTRTTVRRPAVLISGLVVGVVVVGVGLGLSARETRSTGVPQRPAEEAEAAFRELQQVWSSGTEAEYLDGYEEPVACFYNRSNAPRTAVRGGLREAHFARSNRPPPAERRITARVVSPTQVILHEERTRADGTSTQGFRSIEMHFAADRWRVRQEVSAVERRCWRNPVPE